MTKRQQAFVARLRKSLGATKRERLAAWDRMVGRVGRDRRTAEKQWDWWLKVEQGLIDTLNTVVA